MFDLYLLLVFIHIVGTVLGAGGATLAEIFIIKALRDGIVSPEESGFLKTTYTVLRFGLLLTILSGFGFLLVFRLSGSEEMLYSEKLWAKMTIILFIAVNAMLLHIRLVPLFLGSAISLISWYAAILLGVLGQVSWNYFEILAVYVIVVALAAPVFYLIKRELVDKVSKQT